MRKRNPEDRFWEKVDVEGDCWEWTASISWKGYGHFWTGERKTHAHRWAWEYLVGPLSPTSQLDHLCRNRACVNPDHLEVVTNRENVLRGEGPTARHARKTHCKHGHLFSIENTYARPDGSRCCRTCLNLKSKAWRKRKREALAREEGTE